MNRTRLGAGPRFAVSLTCLALGCAGRTIDLTVDVSPNEAARGSTAVEVLVLRDCDGFDPRTAPGGVLQRTSLRRGATGVALPGGLPAEFGVAAVLFDDACQVVASGCVSASRSDASVRVLATPLPASSTCAACGCSAADVGVSDAAGDASDVVLRDVGGVDAELDAGPGDAGAGVEAHCDCLDEDGDSTVDEGCASQVVWERAVSPGSNLSLAVDVSGRSLVRREGSAVAACPGGEYVYVDDRGVCSPGPSIAGERAIAGVEGMDFWLVGSTASSPGFQTASGARQIAVSRHADFGLGGVAPVEVGRIAWLSAGGVSVEFDGRPVSSPTNWVLGVVDTPSEWAAGLGSFVLVAPTADGFGMVSRSTLGSCASVPSGMHFERRGLSRDACLGSVALPSHDADVDQYALVTTAAHAWVASRTLSGDLAVDAVALDTMVAVHASLGPVAFGQPAVFAASRGDRAFLAGNLAAGARSGPFARFPTTAVGFVGELSVRGGSIHLESLRELPTQVFAMAADPARPGRVIVGVRQATRPTCSGATGSLLQAVEF